MVLMVVFACLFSWLATKIKRARDERQAVTAIRAMGGTVAYSHAPVPPPRSSAVQPDPPGPKWLRWMLGEHFFAHVELVYFPPGSNDDDLRYLDDLRHVSSLHLRGSVSTPAGRAPIWKHRELKQLELNSSSITDAEIPRLATLTNLEYLGLTNTRISDRAIEVLKQLPSLRRCDLGGTHVSRRAVDAMRPRRRSSGVAKNAPAPSESQREVAALIEKGGGFVQAKWSHDDAETYYEVTLMHIPSPIADELIRHLHRLDGLRVLGIIDVSLDAAQWEKLASPPSLPGASSPTSSDPETDDRSSWLADLRQLVIVDSRDDIDEVLPHVKKLRNLRALIVRGSQVTDRGLMNLAEMTRLEKLELTRNGITDAGLVHLQGLRNLEHLWLFDTQVTDAGLVHLGALSNLKTLDLSDTNVSDAGLVHLKALDRLHEVRLDNTNVTAAGQEKWRGDKSRRPGRDPAH